MEDRNASMKEALKNDTFGLSSRGRKSGPRVGGNEAQHMKSVLYPKKKSVFKKNVPTRRLTNEEYKIGREEGRKGCVSNVMKISRWDIGVQGRN